MHQPPSGPSDHPRPGHPRPGHPGRRPTGRAGLIAAVLVAGALAFGIVTVVVGLLVLGGSEPETCHDRLRPGPNSNTSRLDTTLDVPRSEWPEVEGVLRAFAADRGWSVRGGVGTTDASYRWLSMCDEHVTTIRAGNQDGAGSAIGFGIIHMEYQGPGRDGWRVPYADLHQRLEERWPGRMRYVEGEFGRTIERPEWLDPAPSGPPSGPPSEPPPSDLPPTR